MKNKLFIICLLSMNSLLTQGCEQQIDQAVIDQYNKSCAMCHDTGIANAPKLGDVSQWSPRLEKGMDALVTSVDKGMNAMPPKGMCYDCSDDDFKTLIEYMTKEMQ